MVVVVGGVGRLFLALGTDSYPEPTRSLCTVVSRGLLSGLSPCGTEGMVLVRGSATDRRLISRLRVVPRCATLGRDYRLLSAGIERATLCGGNTDQ